MRAAQREAAAIERRLAKLTEKSNGARIALAEHDQSDYEGLNAKMEQIRAFEAEAGELEERWFALTEEIG